MKVFWKYFYIFFCIAIYGFSSSILVHAESMKNMEMRKMGHSMEMKDSVHQSEIQNIDTKDIKKLDCIERCVGEYDGYFISTIALEYNFYFKTPLLSLDNIICIKNIYVCGSNIDPPPDKIGNISIADFHRILVKVE